MILSCVEVFNRELAGSGVDATIAYPLLHLRERDFIDIDFREIPGSQLKQEFQHPILARKQTGCNNGGFDAAAADFDLSALREIAVLINFVQCQNGHADRP